MISKGWDEVLKDEYKKEYLLKLLRKLNNDYKQKTIYPKQIDVFNALKYTSYKDVKVVILGQDPYHGEGEAEGLSFSVKKGIKIPPSLRNIFKELNSDLKYPIPTNGSLIKWAKEGVLLLNSILTVEKDKPLSHKGLGWEIFTDKIIEKLNEKQTPIVFILWGRFARSKKELITNSKHLIIESTHPSPFSANYGFLGSRPFSKTNEFLIQNKISPVDFNLD